MQTADQQLQALAHLNPDFPAFAAQLPPELTHSPTPLPEGLTADILAHLRETQPETATWLDAQASGQTKNKFCFDVGSIAILAAVLFFLRTRIEIKGKHFSIRHEAMTDELLKKVLDKLRPLSSEK